MTERKAFIEASRNKNRNDNVLHVETKETEGEEGEEESEEEEEESEEEEYEVEDVLDMKVTKGARGKKVTLFCVKWKGYDESHNSWEPKANLLGQACEYHQKLPAKQPTTCHNSHPSSLKKK